MDFSRGTVLLMTTLASLVAVHNAQTPQYGAMNCLLSGNILNVTMFVVKNGSTIIGAEFYDRMQRSADYPAGCQFTGDGSGNNPFKVELQIDITTDDPPTGGSSCGHIYVANSSPKAYKWSTRTYHDDTKELAGDLYIDYTCFASLNTEMTVQQYGINVTILDNNLISNNGVIRMDVVSPDTALVVNEANLGNNIILQLEYVPSTYLQNDPTDIDLRPWGVYCTELYATPDLQSNRKVSLQDSSGCPRTDQNFLNMTSNFKHVSTIVDKYIAKTGMMDAARFDKTAADSITTVSGRVYFVCLAKFCWRKSDSVCTERCQASGRRKRQTPAERITLTTYVNIVDNTQVTDTSDGDMTSGLPIEYTIGLSVLGGAILLAAVALFVCFYARRPRQRDDYCRQRNTSSVVSTPSWVGSSNKSRKQPRY